ncbi:hypothetical protein [Martelella sp. HB161492]|uniref:hypothetical protein n=1 Tax=Martelella sp. HB161492 TaxID=2720726 RepID=UPI0015916B10|nr:hypothetical protein [Martelella sp. HB161492]
MADFGLSKEQLPAVVEPDGHILVRPDLMTLVDQLGIAEEPAAGTVSASRPGIFAIGDVRNGSVKRVASAVGEGLAGRGASHGLSGATRRPIRGYKAGQTNVWH